MKTIIGLLKKYFWEGQKLNEKHKEQMKELPEDAPWIKKILVKHKRSVGILIPFLFVEILWWCQAIKHDYFSLFVEGDVYPRYVLSITMVFGAAVAGMTSEGGGAVAFPVMTLALKIRPAIARDFSLMIQSVGMTAAAFTIFWMKIKLEKNSLLFCSTGAVIGMIFGLEVVDSALTPPQKKLGFVCIWFSFAFSLFLLNRQHKRKTYDNIQNMNGWKVLVLLITGFLGGIFSSIAGSGVDICSFSILCLLFRVSEKVATPTSVILMAINTCVGFYWRQMMTFSGVEDESWSYMKVCIPIVVIFAPLGSIISSHFHRQVLAGLIYVLDTVALVTAFVVIPITLELGLMSGMLLAGGFVVFYCLSIAGQKLLPPQELTDKKDLEGPKGELNTGCDSV